jgi:hypothetical protein
VTRNPYAALVALAERERDLVADGAFESLEAVADERAALIATLPPQAPPSARPALERAAGLQMATSAALSAAVAETRQRLGAMDRTHHAMRAYTNVRAA